MIKLTNTQWLSVLDRIKAEYPVSVWAIGWKQQEVLGFTVRGYAKYYGQQESGVYLDFCNNAQETFFSMKYLNL